MWHVEYLQEEEVILIATSGTMDLGQIRQMAAAALAEEAKRKVSRFLTEHKDVAPLFPVVELYYLPDVLERFGFKHHHKVAVVNATSPKLEGDLKFFETVAFNRGFDVRVFSERAGALRWLHQ